MLEDCSVKPKLVNFAAEIVRQTMTGAMSGGQRMSALEMNYRPCEASGTLASLLLTSSSSCFS